MRSTFCCVASTRRQKRRRISLTLSGYPSPRAALNAARLLGLQWGRVFFGASSGGKWAARSTVNSAYAHMAKRDMPIPPRPTAHFILIQPDLAFGRLQSSSRWSTGSRPPVPPSPERSRGEQTRRRPSGPWDRSNSAGPTASGASGVQGMGQGQPAPLIPAESLGPRRRH